MDNESIVQAEYAAAKREGRQPRCPYCHADLSLEQATRRMIYWQWNGERFERRTADETYIPHCVNCHVFDWYFIDNDFVRLCDPGEVTLFALTEEDAQIMAAQMEIEPLTDDQIQRVRKSVESGLDGWSDALEDAIREAARI